MKNLIQSLKVVVLGLVVAIGISYAFAWTAPTSNPPAGNVAAPVNVSGSAQVKSGSFWSNTFLASQGGGYFGGDIEIENGKGITLGGVKKTAWPSGGGGGGGGSVNWNEIAGIPAGFADGVDDAQIKNLSKIYQCPSPSCSASVRSTSCNSQLTTNSSCLTRCGNSKDTWNVPQSCTFTGYLVW